MNVEGDITRTLRVCIAPQTFEAGIKPVFVFDGPPSALKRATLDKRKAIRTAAKEEMEKAIDAGDLEKARSMGARAVSLNKEMIDEAHLTLQSMGLPIVQAKQEGEAQPDCEKKHTPLPRKTMMHYCAALPCYPPHGHHRKKTSVPKCVCECGTRAF